MAKNTATDKAADDAERAAEAERTATANARALAASEAKAPAKVAAPAPNEAVALDPIEELAREICKTQGRDAETLISYEIPTVIGTPEGNAYLTNPKSLVPMWNCYSAVARATIKLNDKAVCP